MSIEAIGPVGSASTISSLTPPSYTTSIAGVAMLTAPITVAPSYAQPVGPAVSSVKAVERPLGIGTVVDEYA